MPERELLFRAHALRRMFERNISQETVPQTIATGEVIQSYPDDMPYSSQLLLGFEGQRPIHVVAADVPDTRNTVIITVYEPDPNRWSADYRKRRQS